MRQKKKRTNSQWTIRHRNYYLYIVQGHDNATLCSDFIYFSYFRHFFSSGECAREQVNYEEMMKKKIYKWEITVFGSSSKISCGSKVSTHKTSERRKMKIKASDCCFHLVASMRIGVLYNAAECCSDFCATKRLLKILCVRALSFPSSLFLSIGRNFHETLLTASGLYIYTASFFECYK